MKKVVLISGGSDGLGKAAAKLLAPSCDVIILAPNEAKLAEAAKEISCGYEVCDVSDPALAARAVGETARKHGRIDCLINNAGIWIEGPLDANDPADIRRAVDVNATGTILLTRFVLPHMKKAGGGRIVNVISQAGLHEKVDRSVYYASKWAVTGFTRSLAIELEPFRIGVTGFYPGPMRTNLFAKAGAPRDLSRALSPEEAARGLAFIVNAPSDVTIPEFGMKSFG